ncbi:MAG: ATP-binding protein [Patescibacteria group bacterium]
MGIVYITAASLVCILGIIIGYAVYRANKNKLDNKLFSIFAFITSAWIIVDFSLYLTQLSAYQTALNRFNLAVITAMVFFLAYFVTIFPERIFPIKKWMVWLFASINSGIIIITLFSNKIIRFAFMESYGSNFESGSLFNLFAVNVSIVALYAVAILIIKYIKLGSEQKKQIKYMLYGIGLLSILNLIFNLLIPMLTHSFVYARFGTYSSLFFIIFTAYAILKTQLFDVKVIITEAAVVVINVISAIEVFTSGSLSEGALRSVLLIVLASGSVWLVKSVKREIQQRKEIEKLAEELKEANEHLKEVDKLKDDFLSMASHELNTPIAAIQGYLSMILVEGLGGKIPDKARGFLNSVFESAKRLGNMVKDLLNVSRIESGRIHIIWEQKPIEDVINQAVTEVMSKALEAKHSLTFEKPKHKMPSTWFDVTRITEVLINIIGNAIKYTDPGGKIVARVMNDDQKIVVSVQDNGRGIPKDKQTGVFEKFTQVDVLKDQVKGTGLGMYISKKFIELQKGKIWFTSEGEGKGTTFFFTMPILKEKPHDPHEGEDAVLH